MEKVAIKSNNSTPSTKLKVAYPQDNSQERGIYYPQSDTILPWLFGLDKKLMQEAKSTSKPDKSVSNEGPIINIEHLKNYNLKSPISVTVEFDEEYYLAQCVDLPIYASGEDPKEAIDNLKEEIEDLYHELLEDEDDNLSAEWLRNKKLLVGKVIK